MVQDQEVTVVPGLIVIVLMDQGVIAHRGLGVILALDPGVIPNLALGAILQAVTAVRVHGRAQVVTAHMDQATVVFLDQVIAQRVQISRPLLLPTQLPSNQASNVHVLKPDYLDIGHRDIQTTYQ